MTPNPSKVKEFPDISSKLAAPTRKSVFERQRAEAEAKRQREEAENAAALDDFVKSFEGGDDDDRGNGTNSINNNGGNGMGPGFRGGGFGIGAGMRGGRGGSGFRGMPRGHIPTGPGGLGTGAGPGGQMAMGKSGPGTLGPAPSSLQPPSSVLRKRAFDGSIPPARREKEVGLFAFENSGDGIVLDTAKAFQASDDDDDDDDPGRGRGRGRGVGGEHGGAATSEERAAEKAAPKPTLHLSSLPPGTSAALVKSLIPSKLSVDSVRMVPHVKGGSTERRSLSAIVTLAKDTPASDIDSVVSTLQNRYLGWGFYLSLSRHLSSAALGAMGSGGAGLNSLSSSLPFGAKTMPTPERKGFAPPPSYGGMGHGQYGLPRATTRVLVNPPSDIKQLRLIHKTIESLITHGPEFEALLMSRAEVQRNERWAWLWDARSTGGVWYRWKLWEIMTNCKTNLPRGGHLTPSSVKFPFTDGPGWFPPEKPLQFEFATGFNEFVSDADYDSSEEEDAEDEGPGRTSNNNANNMTLAEALGESTGKSYMNPLQKAKLAHLLSRLPKSTARLRKGDVARVTAFAIKHAGEGADEVVNMIVANVERPFAWADPKATEQDKTDQEEETDKQHEKDDPSSSKLIALYLISDILSSSSTSGVRHAWKYRQLFETALKQRRTFEGLGRLEKAYDWGRLRAEKWKRSVNGILSLWESWCVFPQAAQEQLVEAFMNPPLTEAEKKAAAQQKNEETQVTAAATAAAANGTGPSAAAGASSRSKWKTVDEKTAEASRLANNSTAAVTSANENITMEDDEDVDGEPMADADLDGEPMEDIDGEPMQEDDVDGEPMDAEPDMNTAQERGVEQPQEQQQQPQPQPPQSSQQPQPQPQLPKTDHPLARKVDPLIMARPRPRAVDMFADSDEE